MDLTIGKGAVSVLLQMPMQQAPLLPPPALAPPQTHPQQRIRMRLRIKRRPRRRQANRRAAPLLAPVPLQIINRMLRSRIARMVERQLVDLPDSNSLAHSKLLILIKCLLL